MPSISCCFPNPVAVITRNIKYPFTLKKKIYPEISAASVNRNVSCSRIGEEYCSIWCVRESNPCMGWWLHFTDCGSSDTNSPGFPSYSISSFRKSVMLFWQHHFLKITKCSIDWRSPVWFPFFFLLIIATPQVLGGYLTACLEMLLQPRVPCD